MTAPNEKTVYQLRPGGYYVGEATARLSPADLELGIEVYMLPAGCIETAPPAQVKKGKSRRWSGGQWIYEDTPKPNSVAGYKRVWKDETYVFEGIETPKVPDGKVLQWDDENDAWLVEDAPAPEVTAPAAPELSPAEKLAAFFASNPDVAALVNSAAPTNNGENT